MLSALENIGLGEPGQVGDEAAARRAAAQAGAAGFNGRDLSMGQWQRMALARAFRGDAALVILDEPSAALDPRAEHELFADVRRLRRLLHGRSALLISHRFSSVRSADRIYVLAVGRVVEAGSHAELMALGGLYSELFRLRGSRLIFDRKVTL